MPANQQKQKASASNLCQRLQLAPSVLLLLVHREMICLLLRIVHFSIPVWIFLKIKKYFKNENLLLQAERFKRNYVDSCFFEHVRLLIWARGFAPSWPLSNQAGVGIVSKPAKLKAELLQTVSDFVLHRVFFSLLVHK